MPHSNLKPEPKGYIASTIGGAVNTGIQIAAMRLLGIQGQLLSNVAVGLVLPLFSFCDFLPHSFFEQRCAPRRACRVPARSRFPPNSPRPVSPARPVSRPCSPFGLQLLSGAFHFGSGAIKGAIIGLML